MNPIATAILPDGIKAENRDALWEVIAVGSLPFLTVPEDTETESNEWPIVRCDAGVTNHQAEQELKVLKRVARNCYSRIRFR